EVPAVLEDAGVDQLELSVLLSAAPALLDEPGVGIIALRVVVERPQIRGGGRRVVVEVALLHVLAVVALGAGEAEQPLLQDRVATVPERDGEAEAALAVREAEQPVLAPAVPAAARVVVGKIV